MYTVVAIELDGCELSSTEENTFMEARNTARTLSKDRELIRSGAHKVEVRDSTGECIYDRLMAYTKAQLEIVEPVTDA